MQRLLGDHAAPVADSDLNLVLRQTLRSRPDRHFIDAPTLDGKALGAGPDCLPIRDGTSSLPEARRTPFA